MKNKKINRRKFLSQSLKTAAGLGVIASCDRRTIIGTDVRKPSAPLGLSKKLSKSENGEISVILSWKPHDFTDITGAKTETSITYKVYREDVSQPIAQNLLVPTYTDKNGLEENKTYIYRVSAVDSNGNEGPLSNPLIVSIQPFVTVYRVKNTNAVPGTISNPNINSEEVKKMVNEAIMALTGQPTVASAWESLFPNITTSTLIGIKINTLAGAAISTKPQVVDAIVWGLTQMLNNTFPEYNIIVFDDRNKDDQMKKSGFPIRDEPGKYRIATIYWNTTLNGVPITQSEPDEKKWLPAINIGGVYQRVTALIDSLDYIINVPVLKDHSAAGITFALKNFYGTVENPSKLHGNMCDPYISEIYNLEINGKKLKDKIRVIIGDALLGCSVNGPPGPANIKPCSIIAGTDPVATDTFALDIINSYRPATNQISMDTNGAARHIFTASQPPYSLGSTNYSVKEIIL
jgi:uncharacterized protein (DUF362 family)